MKDGGYLFKALSDILFSCGMYMDLYSILHVFSGLVSKDSCWPGTSVNNSALRALVLTEIKIHTHAQTQVNK